MRYGTLFGMLVVTLSATPALAHHPLAGEAMTTFGHGLLSGIGHPLLGFDHLFFIVAMGVTASLSRKEFSAPIGYLAAMLAGVGLTASGVVLPLVEPFIILSLLVGGIVLALGIEKAMRYAVVYFAFFGLAHGAAFGDSIAAQESFSVSVLIGYLIGLFAIQFAIAVAAGRVLSWVQGQMPRLVGAAVAGVGIFLALEALEGAVFDLLV